MQTLVQVICRRGSASLRDFIDHDPWLERFNLQVTEQQRPGRSPGWSKLHSTEPEEIPGAINVQWDPQTAVLTCRIVTRQKKGRNVIVGRFTSYLLERFRSDIQVINVVPR